MFLIIIGNSEFIIHYSDARRMRAHAYSRALRPVREVVQRSMSSGGPSSSVSIETYMYALCLVHPSLLVDLSGFSPPSPGHLAPPKNCNPSICLAI